MMPTCVSYEKEKKNDNNRYVPTSVEKNDEEKNIVGKSSSFFSFFQDVVAILL